MLEFADFARAQGLIPGTVVADARWHRCPTEAHPRKKNGSWKLAADGGVGWVMNWEIHDEPAMWRPERQYIAPHVNYAEIAKRKAEERRALIAATKAARDFYLGCKPLHGGHPYLKAHQLDMTGCTGLKVDGHGWLVVPVLLERGVISVQRISPEGDKKFWPGASVKGGSYQIERPAATVAVLCEGLATGLSIFAAAPLSRVVVAFNSGNLSRVEFPRRGLAVVAADNDHETQARIGRNPGVDAATGAAEALGCIVAVPAGIQGTDWCDYRMERLAERVKALPMRSYTTEAAVRKEVDAEINAAMMKNARFLRPRTVRARAEEA